MSSVIFRPRRVHKRFTKAGTERWELKGFGCSQAELTVGPNSWFFTTYTFGRGREGLARHLTFEASVHRGSHGVHDFAKGSQEVHKGWRREIRVERFRFVVRKLNLP